MSDASRYNLILSNVSRFIDLDEQETEYFIEALSFQEVKKKEFLMRPRQTCNEQYFVNKGCLKKYNIDNNGVEHASMFAIEDFWTGDMLSFTKETPSTYFIQALEDTEVLSISDSNLNALFSKVPKFERFFRILYQRSLAAVVERTDQNLALSAEERYLNFVNKYPSIELRISQKDIASYIGVTPEFLSLLKKRLYKS